MEKSCATCKYRIHNTDDAHQERCGKFKVTDKKEGDKNAPAWYSFERDEHCGRGKHHEPK